MYNTVALILVLLPALAYSQADTDSLKRAVLYSRDISCNEQLKKAIEDDRKGIVGWRNSGTSRGTFDSLLVHRYGLTIPTKPYNYYSYGYSDYSSGNDCYLRYMEVRVKEKYGDNFFERVKREADSLNYSGLGTREVGYPGGERAFNSFLLKGIQKDVRSLTKKQVKQMWTARPDLYCSCEQWYQRNFKLEMEVDTLGKAHLLTKDSAWKYEPLYSKLKTLIESSDGWEPALRHGRKVSMKFNVVINLDRTWRKTDARIHITMSEGYRSIDDIAWWRDARFTSLPVVKKALRKAGPESLAYEIMKGHSTCWGDLTIAEWDEKAGKLGYWAVNAETELKIAGVLEKEYGFVIRYDSISNSHDCYNSYMLQRGEERFGKDFMKYILYSRDSLLKESMKARMSPLDFPGRKDSLIGAFASALHAAGFTEADLKEMYYKPSRDGNCRCREGSEPIMFVQIMLKDDGRSVVQPVFKMKKRDKRWKLIKILQAELDKQPLWGPSEYLNFVGVGMRLDELLQHADHVESCDCISLGWELYYKYMGDDFLERWPVYKDEF